MDPDEREKLKEEFSHIFTNILRGRRIESLRLNELGMFSIMVADVDASPQRIYEIDSLSSGEKGLALTFLLIAKSLAKGGIVLLDEPELHLNPAICKDILYFLINFYSVPKNVQFLMCTHSPEILHGAFSSEHCSLFHVVSERVVSKVSSSAIDEYAEALQKLGTSFSESLFYRGTIFVEGDDDVAFLEVGFPDLLKRFKIKDRGGRKEVEKTAARIQELEAKGEKVEPIYIIFDRDNASTSLTNSAAVRILQWKRRCLENYLIDVEVLTRLLKSGEVTNRPFSSEGEVSNTLRGLAFEQIPQIAARTVYQRLGYENPSIRTEDLMGKTTEEIADALLLRASRARNSLAMPEDGAWKTSFINECTQETQAIELTWEGTWKESCDGKKLFESFQKKASLRMSLAAFKRRVVQEMKNSASENWRLVESLLKELVEA